MYVETDRDTLQAIKLPEMDKIAEFSDNNVAQVTESDGELLINNIEHIHERNTE